MIILDLVVTLVGLAVFGHHVWALRGHFASDRMTSGARTISLFALVTCLVMIYLGWSIEQPWQASLLGIVLILSSLMLFWGAVRASQAARLRYAFDDAMPQSLVVTGPYQRIRHPFYASYLLFWLGWAIATWTLWALLPVAIMGLLYTRAARYEEGLLGNSSMAADYAAYRLQAGFFWPKF